MIISPFIEYVLSAVDASTVTELICLVISILFVVAAVCAIRGKCPQLVGYAATLLTSVGILGTFTGIVIGLRGFDPGNIDQSIEVLLAGLKTAFVTSLCGMMASILYKIIVSLFIPQTQEVASDDVGAAEIYRSVNEQTELLKGLQDSIAGEDESTLVGQLKLMRSDVNDNHRLLYKESQETKESTEKLVFAATEQSERLERFTEKLWIKLQDFADMLSKSATETVINALKDVIRDFNDNLTEQFGDNFKQLNQSVERLVQWQDQYKQQLEEMIEQYRLGVESISQTEVSVAEISKESKSIPLAMEALKDIIDVNQHQIDELSRHLETFRDMRDRAVEAVPQIRSQVEETVNEIARSTEHVGEYYKELLAQTEESLKNQAEVSNNVFELFTDKTEAGINTVQAKLNESAIRMELAIQEGVTDFTNKVHQTNASLQGTSDHLSVQSEEIKNHLQDTVRDLNSHARQMVEEIISGSNEMRDSLKLSSNELMDNASKIQDRLKKSTEEIQDRLEGMLADVFRAQAQEVKRTFDSLEKELQSQVGKTGEAVEKQLGMIDQSMNQETQRVMQAMGEALARISGQFTTDYTKLVESMAAVVRRNAA